MKRLLIASAALLTTVLAAPAFAQSVSGTINVTGSVATKCQVIPVVGDGSSFTGLIALGELADSDGTLKDTLQSTTSGSPAGSVQVRVNCSGSTANLSLSSTRLSDNNVATPPTGYSDDINYTSRLSVNLATGGPTVLTYDSTSLPAASTGSTTAPLANAANNVTVSMYNLHAEGGDTDLLVASTLYASTISVLITPVT